MAGEKDRRQVSSVLKTPGLSKRYYVNVFAAGTAFLAILMFYAVRMLGEVNSALAKIPDAGLSTELQDQVYTVAILFFVCFFVFLLSTVMYLIILTHRVGGPVVAICAYIRELKRGNYDARRPLRKNDELVPIMLELQDLARTLRARGNKN